MSSRRFESDIVLPVEAPFSSGRELRKGCTFFITLAGAVSAANGLLLLIGRKHEGPFVLLISGAIWLLWAGLRVAQRLRERARIAEPSGHIRLTSSEIDIPSLSGKIDTVRWIDLKEMRLTREVTGEIYYEFYAGQETPAILLNRSRVKDSDELDHELESRTPKIVRTFELERPAPVPPIREASDYLPPGERFELTLPRTGWHTLRGCGGLLLALAILLGMAFTFPDVAMKWMSSEAGMAAVIAVLLLGIWLATKSPKKGCLLCAADGLHIRTRGKTFPAFIRWSDLVDYTFVSTGLRNTGRSFRVRPPLFGTRSCDVTVWTSEGSWKLEAVRIPKEEDFLSILRHRSARKPQSFQERIGTPPMI